MDCILQHLRPLWSFILSCNCLQCSENLGAQGEPSERALLLASDPVNHSPALRRTNSDNLSNEFSQSLPKKDDQNALSRLVQNTAINMIDIGAMDLHNMEHQEYNDRIKLYSHRLQQQWNNIQHPGIGSKGILKDVPNPQFYLVKATTPDDAIQIKKYLEKARLAIHDVKIDHHEAIVVPFRIP